MNAQAGLEEHLRGRYMQQPDRGSATVDPQELWYSVGDVARRFRISERSLRAAIASGHLQVVRPAGLRRGRFPVIRIPESALTAWLNSAPTSAGHE
jgi:hypothetical protein